MSGRIPHVTKLEIIRLFEKGFTITQIKRKLQEQNILVTRQAISYWTTQYKTGHFGRLPSSRDKKLTKLKRVSSSDVSSIKTALIQTPATSSTDLLKVLKTSGSDISLQSTKRAIKIAGYTASKPKYNQLVRHVNKDKRVDFCRHLLETNDQFDDVLFSDECSVQLHQNKVTFYRKIGSARPSLPKPKHPLKLHLWGAISKRGATKLVIFDGIMTGQWFVDHILRDALVPFLRRKFPDHHRFQQDNDPKHTSRVSKEFMEQNGINWWKEWPSESADLNPIEMVWTQLKRHLAKENLTTKDQLVASLQHFWVTFMTRKQCRTYIDHIFKVVPVCLLMKGQATGLMVDKMFGSTNRSLQRSIVYFNDLLHSDEYAGKREFLK